jgi:hypothetical protein
LDAPAFEQETYEFIDKGLTKWEMRMRDVEQRYAFQEWAVQVRLPQKEVRTLSLAAGEFEGLPRPSAVSSGNAAVQLRFPTQADAPLDLAIALCDSPVGAQRRVIRGFDYVDSAAPDVVKADRGTEHDVGDVCFYRRTPATIGFARNNVAVTVTGAAASDPGEVLRLARMLDAKIVRSLTDVATASQGYVITVDFTARSTDGTAATPQPRGGAPAPSPARAPAPAR